MNDLKEFSKLRYLLHRTKLNVPFLKISFAPINIPFLSRTRGGVNIKLIPNTWVCDPMDL